MKLVKDTLRINKILNENPDLLNSIIADKKQVNELLKERKLALEISMTQAKQIVALKDEVAHWRNVFAEIAIEKLKEEGGEKND